MWGTSGGLDNKKSFLVVYQALKDFREANSDYDRANFAGLSGREQRWDKLSR